MVPELQWLDEGEQLRALEEVRRSSPEAVAAREASRTVFEHLDAEQAVRLAGDAFPALVDRPVGGPPQLSAGEKVVGYPSDTVAQVVLGGKARAVVESTEPMAIETSPGHRAPVNLSLTKPGSAFEPLRPVVGVVIPKRLAQGVRLPALSLSLTPVDVQGSPLAGSEGVADGAGVLYANTQIDTDTVVKPTTGGFEADTLLRSVDSPGRLYFRVGLPAGASLLQARDGLGPVKVMEEGVVIALIRPPSATDATGTPVSVSMSAKGNQLVLTVAAHGAEYQWPIRVDPELWTAVDSLVAGQEPAYSAWTFQANKKEKFAEHRGLGEVITQHAVDPVETGEYSDLQYETQGASKIYKLEARTAGSVRRGRAFLEFAYEGPEHKGEVEGTPLILAERGSYGATLSTVCPASGCSESSPHNGNLVWYKQIELEPGEPYAYDLEGVLEDTHVYIAQEKGPEVSFNTSEPTIDDGRINAAYPEGNGGSGSARWLGPYSGAIEIKVHDPGIGVSSVEMSSGEWHATIPIYKEGKCQGIQCSENYSGFLTYAKGMKNGCCAQIAVRAENETGLSGAGTPEVGVDGTPPHGITVSGLPVNGEISAAPHTITVEATDEESGAASSGLRSLSVSIDGGPATRLPGPVGESGKYTIYGENLTEGVHRLVVTATDNANNVAPQREFTFDVRHASPVAVGPGTVDPTTGQFSLSATDVSLGGAGGVSRVYKSRNMSAAVEGPLGPQWAFSLGGGEGLTVLPSGSVVLSGSDGGHTTFTRNEKGEFESPKGDSSVKLEAKEREAGKGITEYLLSDAKAGTTTRFTQPEGSEGTTPTYANQFGAEATQLNRPISAAVDSSGDVWVVDQMNSRIVKFSSAGTLLGSYGSYGSGEGQFIDPRAIAINQSTGDVYVTDEGNGRLEELSSSGAFIDAIGWGVSDGKAEAEICEHYCRPGIAGAGSGQLSEPTGLAVDSSGNVWVAEAANARLQEFNSSGKYQQKFGSEGSGEVQFKDPTGVVFSGENLYVVEAGNNRVQELSTAGKYISQFGKGGSGNGEFNAPQGIAADPRTGNLYVADTGNNRVQEFTPAGKAITKFGSAGSAGGQFNEPKGVAVSSSGGIYIADYANNRVQEWMRPTWMPTVAEGRLSSGTTTYAYQAAEVEGKTVIEPTEALAPTPAGVSCSTKLDENSERGCRALTFKYDTKETTAAGESPGQWGNYLGHLERVYFHGWDPSKGAMSEPIAVAQYEYDSKGRLRAEWDPRISPELKTTYGYDAEGHITAVTPPGQEPWLVHYGAIAGDPNAGRLLSVIRPPASTSTALKEQDKMPSPVNTAAPTLSTTSPAIGSTLSVSSNGSWSNSPLAYDYQWEDCNGEGKECAAIVGAVNQSYTPQAHDAGYTLVAQVTAENASGAQTATSALGKAVAMPAPSYSTAFGTSGSESEKLKAPAGVAVDAEGNIWVADHGNNRIAKLSSSGGFTAAYTAESTMREPVGVAVSPIPTNRQGTVETYVTNRASDQIDQLAYNGYWQRTFAPEGSGAGQLKNSGQLVVDANSDVWVADTGNNRIEEFASTRPYMSSFGSEGSGAGHFKGPTGITECGGDLYVVDQGNDRVQEFSLEGKYIRQFGSEGKGAGQFTAPSQIACEPTGDDLYVSDTGDDRVEEFNTAGSFLAAFGSAGSGEKQLLAPLGIAVGAAGVIYVGDSGNNRIEKWTANYSTNNPLPAAPNAGADAVSTVEYHVPVSGSGLPNLAEAEVAKWGQHDDPTEAMALFPPDEPMGWPAADYTRATTDYLDAHGRTVNAASPSGGIATTEYNGTNEVVRTLSADNRTAALKEGSKSVEVSQKLDTENTYNEEGTELVETLGPEHKVKLSSGSEVQARNHVTYLYDENSPQKGVYGLVTKTTDGAQYAGGSGGKAEVDVRTTTTSYSGVSGYPGQENIGWTLRKPTSVTTDPGGLKLTSSTVYEPTTGNVLETITPAGAKEGPLPTYSSQFGELGSKAGQISNASAITLDSKGDIWVSDAGNNRIEEFSPERAFIQTFGWGVSNGKSKLEDCKTACQAGIAGSGEGQLSGPQGITYDPTNGELYVSDTANNRIEEFSTKGAFVKAFGEYGKNEGQLNSPHGLTADSTGNIWVADQSNSRLEKFSEEGKPSGVFGKEGTGPGEFSGVSDVTFCNGNLYAIDYGGERAEEFTTTGHFDKAFGEAGKENGKFTQISRVACDPKNSNLYITDSGANHVDVFTDAGTFEGAFGTAGKEAAQFSTPIGVAINTSGEAYVLDNGNNRVEEWARPRAAAAHDTQTIYYTTAANPSYPNCGEHPEWANLPCQAQPAAQPEDEPKLPVSTFKFTIWDELETTTEKFGSTTRTKAQTYDAAGRAFTSTTSSTTDTPLPTVTNEYNAETGALETQSTTTKGETKTITSIDNTLGQLERYTDAAKNTTTYEYEPDGDHRLTEINDGKGTQTYAYDPTTGYLTKLVDSAAGTFTASYDVEGKMTSETYPNGMTASYTMNSVAEATGLEYVKTTHCSESCTWFSDSVTHSIHGETLAQTSTLAKENYTYDNAGRLTQTQEEPAGEGCTTRLYSYDEESNRTSLTTLKPGNEGKCATEGGTSENHTYDVANRLTDPGVTYETFGDSTKLPASDAGKYELTSSYYVDGQVASQTQHEETLNYSYDPDGRTLETETSKGATKTTTSSHYPGPGEAISWISEGGETWTRNIPGIDGTLTAIQSSSGTTELQLHDLRGNIVATAGLSETETKLLSKYNSTEFGVPSESKPPPKYAWLGAAGLSTELPTGIATKGGASYVPQIAHDLQTEQVVPPGAFPNGEGSDSPYTSQISAWSVALSEAQSAGVIAEYVAKQEAEKKAIQEAFRQLRMEDPVWEFFLWTSNEVDTLLNEVGNIRVTGDGDSAASELSGLFAGYGFHAAAGEIGAILGNMGQLTKTEVSEWKRQLEAGLEGCAYEMSVFESLGESAGECFVAITAEVSVLNDEGCFLTHDCYENPTYTWFPGVAYQLGDSSWWMNSGRVENPIAGPPYWGNPP